MNTILAVTSSECSLCTRFPSPRLSRLSRPLFFCQFFWLWGNVLMGYANGELFFFCRCADNSENQPQDFATIPPNHKTPLSLRDLPRFLASNKMIGGKHRVVCVEETHLTKRKRNVAGLLGRWFGLTSAMLTVRNFTQSSLKLWQFSGIVWWVITGVASYGLEFFRWRLATKPSSLAAPPSSSVGGEGAQALSFQRFRFSHKSCF